MPTSFWSSKEQADDVANVKRQQGFRNVRVNYVGEVVPWKRYRVAWTPRRKLRSRR